MLYSLLSSIDAEALKNLFSDAASSEFSRMLFLFSAAAYIHGKQVSKAVSAKFDELVGVLRKDLEAQQSVLGKLGLRIDNIESRLKSKGEI